MIGRTISHYKILSQLGEGGMGVVYKAEDSKLERTVALKFLAPHLVQDSEVRKRFEREAKAAASLSHPNVCHVYEIDEAEGKTLLAMEYVEGDSLDDRIEKGPLPLNDALDIARQTAEGQRAAHEKGIVHRDVKPGNLLITPDGRVKILDFGLALLVEGSKLTKLDTAVGTVAYMSPEQAQGAEVDHRTDVWALGGVLYEMVSGQRPFLGQYDQALLYEIVNEQPEPLTGLRTGVPVELELLVDKCLAKDAGQRYQSTAELIVDLGTLSEKLKSGRSTILKTAAPTPAAQAVPGDLGMGRKLRLYQALVGVAVLVAAAVSFVAYRPSPEPSVRKFSHVPDDFQTLQGRSAISPDGKHIAYTAGSPAALWILDLDQEKPRRLDDSEGAGRPFWSPDSEFVGFVTGNRLKKISRTGGPAVELCRLPGASNYFLGAWSPEGGSIVFSCRNPTRLYQVPADGGNPVEIVSRIGDQARKATDSVSSPQFLPAKYGRILLYRVGTPVSGRLLVAENLASGERQETNVEAGYFTYSDSGHIVYQRSNTHPGDIWALPFSPKSLTAAGGAFPIARNGGWPSVSSDGTLVFRQESGPRRLGLTIRDREGGELVDTGRRWNYAEGPAFSPEGTRLALSAAEDGDPERDIWVYRLSRDNWTPVTRRPEGDVFPIWSPSLDRIAFSTFDEVGTIDIFTKASDGSGRAEALLSEAVGQIVTDWSRRTGLLLYYRNEEDGRQRDLWTFDPGEKEAKPKLFLSTEFNERQGVFSPDGDWVAYVTDQDGRDEVYVRKFPEGAPVYKVSRQGGGQPRWRDDGRELFFVEGQRLMAVEVTTGDQFSAGDATPLFSDPGLDGRLGFRHYDVAPGGQTFALVTLSKESLASPPIIRIVQNWYQEFRDREQD